MNGPSGQHSWEWSPQTRGSPGSYSKHPVNSGAYVQSRGPQQAKNSLDKTWTPVNNNVKKHESSTWPVSNDLRSGCPLQLVVEKQKTLMLRHCGPVCFLIYAPHRPLDISRRFNYLLISVCVYYPCRISWLVSVVLPGLQYGSSKCLWMEEVSRAACYDQAQPFLWSHNLISLSSTASQHFSADVFSVLCVFCQNQMIPLIQPPHLRKHTVCAVLFFCFTEISNTFWYYRSLVWVCSWGCFVQFSVIVKTFRRNSVYFKQWKGSCWCNVNYLIV